MDEFSYEAIKPLIVEEKQVGREMECLFRAPGSKRSVRAVADLSRGTSTREAITGMAKDGLQMQLKYSVRMALIQFLGNSPIVAGTAMRMTDKITDDAAKPHQFSATEKQNAVVEAFRSVANQFHYDLRTRQWQEANSLPPLVKGLRDRPVSTGYDREVLGRMMVEVARSEGSISMEEQEFLEAHLDWQTIEEYRLHPALSEAELAATSPEVRENLFTLAVAAVLSDHFSSDKEKTLLVHFAKGLQLNQEQVQGCVRNAKFFTLEAAIPYIGAYPESVQQLAAKIKMAPAEAEQFLIDYKKRTL